MNDGNVIIEYFLLVSLVLATMIDSSVDTSNPLQNVSMAVLLLVYIIIMSNRLMIGYHDIVLSDR